MTGEAMIAIGLGVLGIGGPLAVAMAKIIPRRNGLQKPGEAQACRDHELRVREIEKTNAAEHEVLIGIGRTLQRLDLKIERIETKLFG